MSDVGCPICRPPITEEDASIEVTPHPNGYEAMARFRGHVGWAIQKTEELARSTAMMRLNAGTTGLFR